MIVLRVVAIVLVAFLAVRAINGFVIRPAARQRRARAHSLPPGSYEWDRRTDRVTRQLKGVPGPREDPTGILTFLETHDGVEAYTEPRTVVSPLTVVLVDANGDWQRFELKEDRLLRQLSQTRGSKVFDASRVGYPPRMKRPGNSGPGS